MSVAAGGIAASRPRRPEDNSILIMKMPETVRQPLCAYLDSIDAWPQLAESVQLYARDVDYIKKQCMQGNSPSNEFLNLWGGQYNHTAYNLFALLHKNKLFQAMRIMQNQVDSAYHKYIPPVDVASERRATPNTNSDNNQHRLTPAPVNYSNSLESPSEIGLSVVQREAHSLLQIDYKELDLATDHWRPENKLGRGGFGEVYKGEWKQIDVAIKVMDYVRNHENRDKINLQQSYNELKYLNSIRHDYILALYGYSINGEKPCLVYQLMKGGSLDYRLRPHKSKKPPLTWQQRLNIALGTASGIGFLHSARDKPLIHGDIKPANILLDQHMSPKIGDFGLAREGPKSIGAVVVVRKVFGTRIYLPPEFLSSYHLSTSVDIYSFGVVLLEMFTGNLMAECTQQAEQSTLLDNMKRDCSRSNANRLNIFDNQLVTPMGVELDNCLKALDVGLISVSIDSKSRPSMAEIVDKFKAFSTDP